MQQLDSGCDENSLENVIKTAEIIVGQPPLKRLLPAETKCPELRFIQMTWAGTDQYTQSSIPFPKDTNLILDKDYISKCIENIKSTTNNRYDIFDFQYDISPNPVLSTMIQVVDDTNSNYQRRKNIHSSW